MAADEVSGFILIPGEVVPGGTAEALAQVHDQSVITDLFPLELEQGSGLGEEVVVEIIKCFRVDGGHAHGGDELAELVHDTVGGTLTDRQCAGIVGRGMAGDAMEHVRSDRLLAPAEAVGHSAAEPRDAVADTGGVVNLAVERVNVKVHIVGQVAIYRLPLAGGVVPPLQDPVEGHLSFGSQVARVAQEQLVQLGPSNIGVAVVIKRGVRVNENPATQRMIQRQQAIRRHLRDTFLDVEMRRDGVRLQVLDQKPAILRLRTEAQKPQ